MGTRLAHMLTTVDNPYDPFEDYDRWYEFDTSMGYHTNAYFARVARISEELSDADYYIALEQAIDEIVKYNILGLYRKVTKQVSGSRLKVDNDLEDLASDVSKASVAKPVDRS